MGAPNSEVGYTSAITRRGSTKSIRVMWWHWRKKKHYKKTSRLIVDREICSSSGAELPLLPQRFGLLNDLFPFPSILDADDQVFNSHLANILFDVILPSVIVSSL
jgi:hypothetical protein